MKITPTELLSVRADVPAPAVAEIATSAADKDAATAAPASAAETAAAKAAASETAASTPSLG